MKVPNDVQKMIVAGECDDHWVVLDDGEQIFGHQVQMHPLSDNIIVVITNTETYSGGTVTVESAQRFVKWDRVKKIVG